MFLKNAGVNQLTQSAENLRPHLIPMALSLIFIAPGYYQSHKASEKDTNGLLCF